MNYLVFILGVILVSCSDSSLKQDLNGNGQITLEATLGKGMYSTIYQALHNQKRFAVKVIAKQPSGMNTFEVANEIAAMHKLKGSPFTSQLVSVHWDARRVYLVMKLEPIGSASGIQGLTSNGSFKLHYQLAQRALVDLISAINHIHSKRIMHGDISADNILITNDFRFILADFGSSLHKWKTVFYLSDYPAHYPPECVLTGSAPQYKPASDIWACGASIHHMIVGDTIEQSFMDSSIPWTLKNCPSYTALYQFLNKYMLNGEPSERATAPELIAMPEVAKWNISNENLDTDAKRQINVILSDSQPELRSVVPAASPNPLTETDTTEYNSELLKRLAKLGCNVEPTDFSSNLN